MGIAVVWCFSPATPICLRRRSTSTPLRIGAVGEKHQQWCHYAFTDVGRIVAIC